MSAGATASLLERVRAGDGDAWPALVARFDGRLRLLVAHRMGRALSRRLDAEDVLQETWIRAVPRVAEFRGDGENAFWRFLATLAGHVIVDAAREARARKRDGRPLPLVRGDTPGAGVRESSIAARTAGPATRAERSERAALLERAFRSLPPRHRRVIALRQFEQRPAREVASLMGATEGAVHALYRRALVAWGEAYESLGGAPA